MANIRNEGRKTVIHRKERQLEREMKSVGT